MKRPLTAIFLLIFVSSMIVVVLHLFEVGSPHLPGYGGLTTIKLENEEITRQGNSVALRYSRQAARDVGATSVVGATILDYRCYDTLFETVVLFTATIAVLAIIGEEHKK